MCCQAYDTSQETAPTYTTGAYIKTTLRLAGGPHIGRLEGRLQGVRGEVTRGPAPYLRYLLWLLRARAGHRDAALHLHTSVGLACGTSFGCCRPGRDIVMPLFISPHSGHGAVFKASPLHPRSPTRTGSSGGGSSGKRERSGGQRLHSASAGPLSGPTSVSSLNLKSDATRGLTAGAPAPPEVHECVGAGVGASGGSCKSLELVFAGRICGGGEQPDSREWPNCHRGINRGYSQGVRQVGATEVVGRWLVGGWVIFFVDG